MFNNFLEESIIKRIIQKKLVDVQIVDFRQFSKNKTKRVDDYQFGGGPGMVIRLEPIVEAIKHYKKNNTKIILLSPQGKVFNQTYAESYVKEKNLIIIAGHYEGFDERIKNYVDEIISIGDYVLTGGEIPAMVIMDSVMRLVDNAINKESLKNESFSDNLLDYPIYTKPIEFDGQKVPDILLSGNHKKIEAFRQQERLKKTKINREDLYQKYMEEQKHGKVK
jgi:tRNA (guanine37-N1)-methyltransferase